jgi:hypothetical protein
MHYLSCISSVTSTCFGHIIAHHLEVSLYIHNNLYVLYILIDCLVITRQSTETYNTVLETITFILAYPTIYIYISYTCMYVLYMCKNKYTW